MVLKLLHLWHNVNLEENINNLSGYLIHPIDEYSNIWSEEKG